MTTFEPGDKVQLRTRNRLFRNLTFGKSYTVLEPTYGHGKRITLCDDLGEERTFYAPYFILVPDENQSPLQEQ